MKRKFIKIIINQSDNIFFSLGIIFSFFSLLFINLKINAIASIFFLSSIAVAVAWVFFRTIIFVVYNREFKKIVVADKMRFFALLSLVVLVALTSIIAIISFVAPSSSFTLGKLNYLVIFLLFGAVLYLVSFGNFKKYIFVIPITLSLILSIVLILSFVFGFGRTYGGLNNHSSLTLNFSNPNLAAIVLATLILINIYSIFYFSNKIFKILSFLINIPLIILLFLTSGRAPFVSVILAFCFMFFVALDKNKHFTESISLLVAFTPFIFIFIYFVYLKCVYPDWNIVVEETINGKGIGSRFDIWVRGLCLIISSPKMFFLGDYATEAGNFHNSLITVMIDYGFIGLLLYCGFLFIVISYIIKKTDFCNRSQWFGIVFLLFSLFLGTVEATPIVSSNGMFFFFCFGILMVRYPLGKSLFSENANCCVNQSSEKILYISNVYGYGSIGKIVRECHLSLLKNGYDSYVIYGRGESSSDKNVVSTECIPDLIITKVARRLFKSQSIGAFYSTNEIIKVINHIKPKTIHITALNDDYLNYVKLFKFLRKKNIRVIYTNHSEYLYIGLCGGHAYDCAEFKKENGCSMCSFYNSKKANKCFLEKKKGVDMLGNKLVTTSVSPWIHSRVSESSILRNIKDIIILNGSSLMFSENSITREELIKKYNLRNNCNIILHVTPSTLNKSKRFDDVLKLAKRHPLDQFVVLTLIHDKEKELPLNVCVVENVRSEIELSSFYNAADLLVLTGTRETFSMPVIESLLCGTPVVGYCCGGPESITLSNYSKFVENGNIDLLDKTIDEFLINRFDRSEIKREAALKYSAEVMVNNYLSIYNISKYIGTKMIEINI